MLMTLLGATCFGLFAIFSHVGFMNLERKYALMPIFWFVFTGVAFYYLLLKSLTNKPKQFIQFFMGGLSLKMLMHLFILVLVDFSVPNLAIQFTVLYAMYYLIFTIAEVLSHIHIAKGIKA